MSLTTKLNLMKLKSNSNHHTSSTSAHTSSSAASSPMSTSNSVPIFTFKNDSKSDDASVSMIGSQFLERDLSTISDTSASTPTKSFSLSSSPSSQTTTMGGGGGENNRNKHLSSSGSIIESRKLKKNLGTYDSNEEDSPESSGDEYVHNGFVDEENKLIET